MVYFLHLSATPGVITDITNAAMKAHDEARAYGISKIAFNFTNINSHSLTYDIIEDEIANVTAEATVDPISNEI